MITDLGPVDEDGDYSVIEEAAVCWKLLASSVAAACRRARGVGGRTVWLWLGGGTGRDGHGIVATRRGWRHRQATPPS